MDIVSFPLGKDVKVDLSLAGGAAVLTVTVVAKAEVDALLQVIKSKLPLALQPLVDAAQIGIDAALA